MAKPVRKPRTHPRIRRAVEENVLRGRTLADAAEIAGCKLDSLQKAYKRPEIIGYRNLLIEVMRTGAAGRTIAAIDELAKSAVSEHVKLGALQHLASLDTATTPTQRNETRHLHEGGAPGLVIIMQNNPAPHVIDGAQPYVPASHLKYLPAPVPHPAQVRMRELAGPQDTASGAADEKSESGEQLTQSRSPKSGDKRK